MESKNDPSVSLNDSKQEVQSRDIYELAFYLTKTGCQIKRIEVTEELGKPVCIVTVSGENLKSLQLDYLNCRNAEVDAVGYRKNLNRIRSLVFSEIKRRRQE